MKKVKVSYRSVRDGFGERYLNRVIDLTPERPLFKIKEVETLAWFNPRNKGEAEEIVANTLTLDKGNLSREIEKVVKKRMTKNKNKVKNLLKTVHYFEVEEL